MSDPRNDEARATGGGVLSAGGAMLFARIFTVFAQLGLFFYAARVLTPADFGLFAIVSVVTLFLGVAATAGWNEFVLSTQDDGDGVNHAITASIVSAVLSTAICFAVAGGAWLASSDDVALLLLISSAGVLALPPERTFSALYIRDGRLWVLAGVAIVAETIGLAAGVFGLLGGYGIFALAAARSVMQVLRVVGAILFSNWKFRPVFASNFAASLYEISRSIFSVRIVQFISMNVYVVIIGGLLGTANAGMFRAAQRIDVAIFEMVSEPFRAISWMVFRNAVKGLDAAQDIRHALAQRALSYYPLLILCIAPVFIGVALVSDNLVVVLLGEQWRPVGPVAAILAIATMLTMPALANEPTLSISGNIRVLPRAMIINVIVTVTALLIFTQFGIIAAALARLFASVVFLSMTLWMQHRYVGVAWFAVVRNTGPVFAGLLAMIGAVFFAGRLLDVTTTSALAALAIQIPVGVISYFLTIFIVRPSFLPNTLRLR